MYITIHHGLVHYRRVVHQVLLGEFLDELLSNRYSSGLKIDVRLGKVFCKVGIALEWKVSM